jgi:hypothetical protein
MKKQNKSKKKLLYLSYETIGQIVLVSCNEMTAITFILLVKPLAILLANV